MKLNDPYNRRNDHSMLGSVIGLGLLFAIIIVTATRCQNSEQMSYAQQEQGVRQIVQNQPVPNLGGYSFERQIVIETLKARNSNVVSTYTYMIVEAQGRPVVVEVCASLGYPIPYATQITKPSLPEANALYYPDSAEASWINCVQADGSVVPTYFEPRVFALPYRIKADMVFERDGSPASFSVRPAGK